MARRCAEQFCALEPYADPAELVSFPEGDADTPLMAVLDPGSAGGPAQIAYAAISEDANFWHPELRIARLTVSPTGAAFTKDMVLYGFDAHAWGQISRAPGATPKVALSFYHADEANPNVTPGFRFRSFDPATWSPGPEVDVDPTGTVAYRLVANDSGYAVCYRGLLESGDAEPRLAVLDTSGQPVSGPLPVSAATGYPGRSCDVAWTGQSHLIATSIGDCDPLEITCNPFRVQVQRLGLKGDLIQSAEIAPLVAGEKPYRSVIGSNGKVTWLAWSEAAPEPKDAPRTVRLARLDENGALAAEPIVLATGAHPVHAMSIDVGAYGVLVWWGEPVDDSLPETTPGNSQLVLHHLTGAGAAIQEPLLIPTTSFAYGLPPTFAALDPSIGAVLSWGARSASAERDVTWLSRLRCAL